MPKARANVVMIDNYDSFTFNLVQYLQQAGMSVETIRNDELSVDEVIALKPQFFVISPGPSDPDHAGICLDLVRACLKQRLPLLGVCLGHQAIGQAMGGKVLRAKLPMHGKVSKIRHRDVGIFTGLPQDLLGTRYHSLIVDRASLPGELEVTAETDDGTIMGFRHKELPIEGIQFHPESVLTEHGHQMLANFAAHL